MAEEGSIDESVQHMHSRVVGSPRQDSNARSVGLEGVHGSIPKRKMSTMIRRIVI